VLRAPFFNAQKDVFHGWGMWGAARYHGALALTGLAPLDTHQNRKNQQQGLAMGCKLEALQIQVEQGPQCGHQS